MDEQGQATPVGEAPLAADGEKPRIFNNINGWIGGITGVLLALAGLNTAYRQLMPDDKAEPVAAVGDNGSPAEPASAEVDEAAYELPRYYETDGLTLEYTGGLWVETDSENATVYRFEQLSRDDDMTVAVDRERDVYLRWPNEGGKVQESDDKQATWSDVYTAYPPAEEAPAT